MLFFFLENAMPVLAVQSGDADACAVAAAVAWSDRASSSAAIAVITGAAASTASCVGLPLKSITATKLLLDYFPGASLHT